MPHRPTALVTGASSGIGREFARVLARNGFDLVLVARNKKALEELADELRATGAECIVLRKDLSKPHAPDDVLSFVKRRGVSIELLINNAGFGLHGPFVHQERSQQLDLLQVNIVAVTHLTRLFAAEMVPRGRGRILNVASTAAFQPGPLMALYYASKAYVLSFSEALAVELAGTGVTVSCLCPGPTRTDFHRRAHMEHVHLVKTLSMMDATTVAEAGFRGLMRGRRVIIPGLFNKLGTMLGRLAPHSLIMAVVKFVHRPAAQYEPRC